MSERKADPIVVNQPKKRKQKKWPEGNTLIQYNHLINPLKVIIDEGYRLIRKQKKEFDYGGYNIGKREAEANQSLIPNNRLTETGLLFEKISYDRNLIDVVLNIAFLLGIEQGRRVDRLDIIPVEDVVATNKQLRSDNKDLRLRIDQLEAYIEAKETYPTASQDELNVIISKIVKSKKGLRIAAIKDDMSNDKMISSFSTKSSIRPRFEELEGLFKANPCSLTQWKELLENKSWTLEEWHERCKHKFIDVEYKDQPVE